MYVLKFYCNLLHFFEADFAEANTSISNVSVTQKFSMFVCPTVLGSGDLIGSDIYRSGASSLELSGFVCT